MIPRGLALLCMISVVFLAGCSQPADKEAGTPDAAPDSGARPQQTDAAAAEGLPGTKWEIGPYVLEFKDPPDVHISGEGVPVPNGVNGSYAVKDGQITVSAAGESHKGTWDGASLVIDGVNGKKAEAEAPAEG